MINTQRPAADPVGQKERFEIGVSCMDGRKIGGRWSLSALALEMLLSGDQASLEAYHAGYRLSARVRTLLRSNWHLTGSREGDEREW